MKQEKAFNFTQILKSFTH